MGSYSAWREDKVEDNKQTKINVFILRSLSNSKSWQRGLRTTPMLPAHWKMKIHSIIVNIKTHTWEKLNCAWIYRAYKCSVHHKPSKQLCPFWGFICALVCAWVWTYSEWMGALQHRNGLLNLSGESFIGKKCNAWREKKAKPLVSYAI